MFDEERAKLANWQKEYISIGIATGGSGRPRGIPVPWESTTQAFNMKTPDVYIEPEDLKDKDLLDRIKSFQVLGCYVLTQLDDYGFIAEFKDLRDIYILNAVNVKDLSFLSELQELWMLHLECAHLKDLKPILQSSLLKRPGRGFCLSFTECTVDDVSALCELKRIVELIVVGEDDDAERAKWKSVPALTRRYYAVKR